MPRPKAEKPLIRVCANVFDDEWKEFQEMWGMGNASERIRELIREDITANRTLNNASR